MPGLVPGIHVFLIFCTKDVDGRDKPGHDEHKEKGCANVAQPIFFHRHCEEQSDGRSNPYLSLWRYGLLRFARK
jgi:hypothetical protein